MAMHRGYVVEHIFQGVSKHCWLTCVEMLMAWRYKGFPYGLEQNGNPRMQHPAEMLSLKAAGNGASTDQFSAYYGLTKVRGLYGFEAWRSALETGGPILAGGHYGFGAIGMQHAILFVGLSGSNKLVYWDPATVGSRFIIAKYSYMSPADAENKAMNDDESEAQFVQAPRGGPQIQDFS